MGSPKPARNPTQRTSGETVRGNPEPALLLSAGFESAHVVAGRCGELRVEGDEAVAASIDAAVLTAALTRCDAYPLLTQAGGLIRTGPTGTNVADLRIVLTHP